MVGILKHFSKKFIMFYERENAVKEERKAFGGRREMLLGAATLGKELGK